MNQNLEQLARDRIDALQQQSNWLVQHKGTINLAASAAVVVREYLPGKTVKRILHITSPDLLFDRKNPRFLNT